MIDKRDFPNRTPQDRLKELRRIGRTCTDWSSFEEQGRELGERIDRLFHKYIVARKDLNLRAMTLEELLERFEEICLVEDETYSQPDEEGANKYNECEDSLWAVHAELKLRGLDARRALLRLYSNPNHQVQLQAALFSYSFAPELARRLLENLRDAKLADASLKAASELRDIDAGVFVEPD